MCSTRVILFSGRTEQVRNTYITTALSGHVKTMRWSTSRKRTGNEGRAMGKGRNGGPRAGREPGMMQFLVNTLSSRPSVSHIDKNIGDGLISCIKPAVSDFQ